MKQLTLLTMILLAASFPVRGQLTLNAGDTYTYRFDTLPRTGITPFGSPSGLLGVAVNSTNLLQPGDALLFEMFEDSPGGSPIFSRTVTAESGPLDFQGTVTGAWQDLQGSIRLTMISGSTIVEQFSVLALRPAGPSGLNQFSATIVPEPRPVLSLAPSPAAMAIRWPAAATNYVLEATPTLSLPNQWQAVTNSVERIDGIFSVTVDYQLQSRFFRLRRVSP